MQAKDVMALIKEKGIRAVDIRFVDLPGLWQHFTLSTKEFSEDAFTEGLGFDGSSIRGFQQIQESDMLLIPDPSTAFVDPFTEAPTLVLIANVLAWPGAYHLMDGWLDNFPYRISLSPSPFALCAGATLVIALITICYQSVKAALANPVEALRYE